MKRLSPLFLCLFLPFIMGFTPTWGTKLNPQNGVQKYRRHIQVPALSAGIPASQPDAVTVNAFGCLRFPTTGTRYSYFQFEMPLDWIDTTDLVIEVDWFPETAMAGTDTVSWNFNYQTRAEGETLAGTTTTETVSNNDDNAQYLIIHSPVTLDIADATNPLVHEDHVFFQVTRNTGVANDFGGNVCVTAFEILYWSEGVPEL